MSLPPPDQCPISVRGLGKVYTPDWGGGTVRALAGLDLEVRRGEVFGLLGPNGSGKSTTLKIILGLIHATEGEACVFGASVSDPATRRRLGYLPENPHFYRYLTGRETLRFFGELCGLRRAAADSRARDLLAKVGLNHGADRALAGYSKGMLQRIGLAQALMHDPELVVLDEPTAGVDPVGSRDIRDLILDLKCEGRTVLLCSHLLEQVEEVCDRVTILHQGRKVLEGALSELLSDSDALQITVRNSSASPQDTVATLTASGYQIESVRRPRLTLEELFLRHIGSTQSVSQEIKL